MMRQEDSVNVKCPVIQQQQQQAYFIHEHMQSFGYYVGYVQKLMGQFLLPLRLGPVPFLRVRRKELERGDLELVRLW